MLNLIPLATTVCFILNLVDHNLDVKQLLVVFLHAFAVLYTDFLNVGPTVIVSLVILILLSCHGMGFCFTAV